MKTLSRERTQRTQRDEIGGYLKAARIEHGWLINFGSYRFQIKKHAMSDAVRSPIARRAGSLLLSLSALFAFCRG